MRTIKYFTKDALLKANRVAVSTKRNRSLYEEPVMALPDGLRFPIVFAMPHNDVEMRVEFIVGSDPNDPRTWGSVWLDIPFDTYNDLPEVEAPE